jgi:Icc-related predicted phosphoesterase
VRLHVVSDVHAAIDDLAGAADGSDVFICLGDLVLFVDYDDLSQGIFPDLFGAANCRAFVELRTQGRYDEARAFGNALWSGVEQDRRSVLDAAVRRQYEALFAAMPEPALLTYGNVDLPHLWSEYVLPGHQVLDGEAIEVSGVRFGFVGGGLVSPMRTPFEISPEEFAAKVDAVGEVDVLCTHIPPALPEITYDTVARRFERGSQHLLDAVDRWQPRYLLHGHVHQPLQPRVRRGRTEIINVGHFRGLRRPFVLEL